MEIDITSATSLHLNSSVSAASYDQSRYPSWLLTLRGSALVLVFLLGVIANSLTIVAFTKFKKIRNVETRFIISLSTADLLFCLLVLPFIIARNFRSNWVKVPFLCTVVPYLGYCNATVSLLSVVLITISRYLKIVHYNLHTQFYTTKVVAIMIISSWVFSFLLMFPSLFALWGKFGYDTYLGTCDIIADVRGRTSKDEFLSAAFCIPCIVILACYIRILYVVKQSERKIKEFTATSGEDFEAKRKKEELQRTKMFFAIFIAFIVCYLPNIIIEIVDPTIKYPVIHILALILFNCTVFINPAIYVRMNQKYRKAYYNMIKTWFDKLSTLKPSRESEPLEKQKYWSYST